eukprot:m51a1_g2992 hypothetical protein (271) ;mRNA; f:751093-752329
MEAHSDEPRVLLAFTSLSVRNRNQMELIVKRRWRERRYLEQDDVTRAALAAVPCGGERMDVLSCPQCSSLCKVTTLERPKDTSLPKPTPFEVDGEEAERYNLAVRALCRHTTENDARMVVRLGATLVVSQTVFSFNSTRTSWRSSKQHQGQQGPPSAGPPATVSGSPPAQESRPQFAVLLRIWEILERKTEVEQLIAEVCRGAREMIPGVVNVSFGRLPGDCACVVTVARDVNTIVAADKQLCYVLAEGCFVGNPTSCVRAASCSMYVLR